jgi:hypothetical protein
VRGSTIGFVCAGLAIAGLTALVIVDRRKHDDAPTPVPSSVDLMPPVVVLPPPLPRHDVLVVTEPNDATVIVNVTSLGIAPVTIDVKQPMAVRVLHDGYREFIGLLDERTPPRFVVKLEKEPKRTAKPTSNGMIRDLSPEPRTIERPADCPADLWDPFTLRCTGRASKEPDPFAKPLML